MLPLAGRGYDKQGGYIKPNKDGTSPYPTLHGLHNLARLVPHDPLGRYPSIWIFHLTMHVSM